jgi:hypothetical protein
MTADPDDDAMEDAPHLTPIHDSIPAPQTTAPPLDFIWGGCVVPLRAPDPADAGRAGTGGPYRVFATARVPPSR